MKKPVIIIAIIIVVLGLGVLLFIQDAKNADIRVENTGEELEQKGEAIELQEATHIQVGSEHAPYNSNPPTSGPHYEQPADWGVYPDPLVDEQVVHNLEHGGIWISYKDIDDTTKQQLERIAKANSGSVIMTPRPANDAPIVLASWGRLQKLQSYDETAILDFIRANKNKSPEPLAR